MPEFLPPAFWTFWFAVFGLVVGSFLNVAIYRLPREGMSMGNPRRSRCPSCGHAIRARENIPLLSWLILRGRCSSCGAGISWRYPLVEALTGGLFVLALHTAPAGAVGLVAVWCLVLSGLTVASFVDLEFFEIPDEISIGGVLVAPIAALLLPELHAASWIAQQASEGAGVDRFGALLNSIAGILAGGGVLWAIGAVGGRVFKRDAMGLGDVKLLAAGGGFVGPGGALAALLLGAILASVIGLANMVRFTCLSRGRASARGSSRGFGRSLAAARISARYLPFGPYLGLGVGIALLDWKDVSRLLDGLFGL